MPMESNLRDLLKATSRDAFSLLNREQMSGRLQLDERSVSKSTRMETRLQIEGGD